MRKILIFGNTSVSACLADTIRAKDPESDITILCVDAEALYEEGRLINLLSKDAKLKNVFCKDETYYKQNNIKIVKNKKFVRANFKKKIIVTEKKEQFEYDILIITDAPNVRLPDVKGSNKSGVFSLLRLNDIQKIMAALPLAETVAIQQDSLQGLESACVLKERGKEVLYITKNDQILADKIEKESAEKIAQSLKQKGIQIILQNEISELLGNGDIKAVRLHSGKVHACEIVILNVAQLDLGLFQDAGLKADESICADDQFCTSEENIFALGRASQSPSACLPPGEQAGLLCRNLFNEPYEGFVPSDAVSIHSLRCNDFSLHIIGRTKLGKNIERRMDISAESQTGEELFIQDGCLVGVVLINNDAKKDEYIQCIKNKTPFVENTNLNTEEETESKQVSEKNEISQTVNEISFADAQPSIRENQELPKNSENI